MKLEITDAGGTELDTDNLFAEDGDENKKADDSQKEDKGQDDNQEFISPEEDDDSSTEDTKEGDPESSEEYATDAEYLEQYYAAGIPRHLTTLSDVLSYTANLSKNAGQTSDDARTIADANNVLARQGYQGGLQAFIANGGQATPQNPMQPTPFEQQPTNQATQSFIPENPVSTEIEDAIKGGQIVGDEQIAWYRNMAVLQDKAIKKSLTPVVNALASMYSKVTDHSGKISEYGWKFLHKDIKDNIPRFELEAIINSGQASDFVSAALKYATIKRPDLLPKIIASSSNQLPNPKKQPAALRGTKRKPANAGGNSGLGGYKRRGFINDDDSVNDKAIERAYPGNLGAQVKVLDHIVSLSKPK